MMGSHILAIPVSLHGHIYPMLNLCCKLASRGCDKITFLINEDKLETMEKLQRELEENGDLARGIVSAEVVPVTMPPAFAGGNDQIRGMIRAGEELGIPTEAVALRVAATSNIPVTCVLGDHQLGWSQDIANKIGVPRVDLWISGLAEFALILQMPSLIAEGAYDPFFEGKHDSAKLITVPGLPPVRASDIPRVSQHPEVLKDWWDYCLRQMNRAHEAKHILINSFYDLEKDTYDALLKTTMTTTKNTQVQFAGPLLSSTGAVRNQAAASSECLQWLDKQAPSSVLYVSFGSFLQMPSSQLENILLGLETSQQRFLLVFRKDMLADDPSPALEAFLRRFSGTHEDHEQGLVVSWAPQQEVLSHSSTGGFFTHYGWNSVMESISAGVPMIGRPLVGDQLVVRRLATERWKIALDIEEAEDGSLSRSDVERAARDVMQSEELRVNVGSLKECLRGAVNEGGDSYQCWDRVAKAV